MAVVPTIAIEPTCIIFQLGLETYDHIKSPHLAVVKI
jgi:hypothetical protein